MRQILPVADGPTVRRYARALLRTHPGALGLTLGLHAPAASAAPPVPWLLGDLVNGVQNGTTQDTVDRTAILIAISVVTAAVFTPVARWASVRFGERGMAALREGFVDRVLELPLSTVERAGTGDLLTRTSRDVDALSHSVRFAVPEILIAFVTTVFIVGAIVVAGRRLPLPLLLGVPILLVGSRWYLRR